MIIGESSYQPMDVFKMTKIHFTNVNRYTRGGKNERPRLLHEASILIAEHKGKYSKSRNCVLNLKELDKPYHYSETV